LLARRLLCESTYRFHIKLPRLTPQFTTTIVKHNLAGNGYAPAKNGGKRLN
jgi:hypothetical protein